MLAGCGADSDVDVITLHQFMGVWELEILCRMIGCVCGDKELTLLWLRYDPPVGLSHRIYIYI